MAAPEFHEFFVASGGVAGALIGLLFVAISVAPERVLADDAQRTHQVRAVAALTAFVNALSVSLFALIPHVGLGGSVFTIGLLGLLFVVGSIVALVRDASYHALSWREHTFLIGLAIVFALECFEGVRLMHHPTSADATSTVCVLVAVCFLIGIARAWELIGGPSISLRSQLTGAYRDHQASAAPSGDGDGDA